jgi:hypothetical protein
LARAQNAWSVAGNRAELVHALKGRDGVQGVTAQASDNGFGNAPAELVELYAEADVKQ